jgi:ankyrin repeat protein
MFAVINTHYETMKVLLEYGADVNAKSNKGGTALMGAALAGDLRMVQALLDKGADLQARLPETNETAVTLAASRGYDEIARLLNAKLIEACRNNHRSVNSENLKLRERHNEKRRVL